MADDHTVGSNTDCQIDELKRCDEWSIVHCKSERGQQMRAYCVKCRAKREMENPKSITMNNRKPAIQGTCHTCGTKDIQNRKELNPRTEAESLIP